MQDGEPSHGTARRGRGGCGLDESSGRTIRRQPDRCRVVPDRREPPDTIDHELRATEAGLYDEIANRRRRAGRRRDDLATPILRRPRAGRQVEHRLAGCGLDEVKPGLGGLANEQPGVALTGRRDGRGLAGPAFERLIGSSSARGGAAGSGRPRRNACGRAADQAGERERNQDPGADSVVAHPFAPRLIGASHSPRRGWYTVQAKAVPGISEGTPRAVWRRPSRATSPADTSRHPSSRGARRRRSGDRR